MTFSKKTIYITGASTGLGRAMALQLAGEGARLALFARRMDLLTKLCDEVRAAGGEAMALTLDVTNAENVAAVFGEAEARFGPADILIANAGVADPVSARRYDPVKAARVFDVNIMGVIHAIGAVLPGMVKRRQGHIVGISSLASYRVFPGGSSYSGSKAGLSMMLRGLRAELLPTGVTVSTICPGFIRTEMTEGQKMPMPFMLDCEPATRRIISAIRRKASVYNFPKRSYYLILLSRLVPDAFFVRMLLPPPK